MKPRGLLNILSTSQAHRNFSFFFTTISTPWRCDFRTLLGDSNSPSSPYLTFSLEGPFSPHSEEGMFFHLFLTPEPRVLGIISMRSFLLSTPIIPTFSVPRLLSPTFSLLKSVFFQILLSDPHLSTTVCFFPGSPLELRWIDSKMSSFFPHVTVFRPSP